METIPEEEAEEDDDFAEGDMGAAQDGIVDDDFDVNSTKQ